MKDGEGELRLANGDVYTGSFARDLYHGHCTFKACQPTDEVEYQGQWHEGLRHGKGTATYVDGSSYDGEWRGGLKHGEGLLTYGSVRVEGTWSEGELVSGREVKADGEEYVGQFRGRLRHGEGRVNLADGSEHVGIWRLGRRSGHATSYDAKTQERHEVGGEGGLQSAGHKTPINHP
jgi:hypothetical protein